ncbi:19679_t:CDS:2, partial [Racocetra fulgida]
LVHDIVQRGGRCLMPVFALGRAQELLLILDEYWEAHPELESVPIYYASSLAKKWPCVMMASPGMLQHAMTEPPEISTLSGAKIPLNMSVDYISFSAHVDYIQNSKFIDEIKAPHVVLVHGESNSMARLKAALQSKYVEREENIKIYSPKNCETVKLYFRGEKLAKAIGRLAAKYPSENQLVSGIIVSKDFQFNIMDPNDLKDFSGIPTSAIIQKQTIAYHSSFSLLRYHLEQMYGPLEETLDDDNVPTFTMETELSPLNTSTLREATENYLRKQFGEIYSKDNSEDEIIIKIDDSVAEEVNTDDDMLRNRITTILPRISKLLHPLEFCP